MKFNNIRLLVNDFDSCYAFYADILGLECTYGGIGENFASFNVGISSVLALFKAELMNRTIGNMQTKAAQPGADKFAIIIQVPYVDESYKKLKSKGVHFITDPADMHDWGIRVAHFRDPEHNLIEIYSDLK